MRRLLGSWYGSGRMLRSWAGSSLFLPSMRSEPTMSQMKCSRCGLSVRLRAAYLALERCPRCLAREGISVPMEIFARPNLGLVAPEAGPLLEAAAPERLGHERSA